VAERDRAAVGVRLLRSAPTSFAQASTTEANASLISNDVDVVDRQAGALEQALRGVDRAGEHQHRVDADEAGVDDAGPRREAELGGLPPRSSSARRRRRRRSATSCRRCGRRLAGDRLELRRASRARSRAALVAGDRCGWCRWACRPRRRRVPRPGPLAVEAALGPRPGGALLRRQPKRSVSSRVMPHFSAMRSAPSNWDVISYWPKYVFGIGTPRPSFLRLFEPIGIRLMISTPHAMATSTTPEPTSDVARLVACWLEPHCVSTVVLAVERQPGRQPRGAGDVEALLADLAHAATDHLADLGGSMPGRSTTADCTAASRSAGCMVDRPPLRLPMGVRTASTMTTTHLGRGRSRCRAGWPRAPVEGAAAASTDLSRSPSGSGARCAGRRSSRRRR
jgi:hypothetical protein